MKLENFINEVKKIEMTHDEKSLMRARLSAHISKTQKPIESGYILSPWTAFFKKGMVLALLVLVISGSSVAFASNNALPGDVLYFIKTNVIERAHSALVSTSQAKALLSEKLVEVRLAEITKLKSSNDLTPERARAAKIAFENNSKMLQSSLQTLAKEGKSDVAVAVTKSLLPHFNSYVKAKVSETETPVLPETTNSTAPVVSPLPSDTAPEKIETPAPSDVSSSPTDETKVQTDSEINKSGAPEGAGEVENSDATLLFASIENQARDLEDQKNDFIKNIPSDGPVDLNTKDGTKTEIDSTKDSTVVPSTSDTSKTISQGTLWGKVSIGPICPVEVLDNPCEVPSEVYTSRSFLVYVKGDQKVLMEVPFRADGTFEASLPAGTYTLALKPNGIDSSHDLPKDIIIKLGEKTLISFSIDTGIRTPISTNSL